MKKRATFVRKVTIGEVSAKSTGNDIPFLVKPSICCGKHGASRIIATGKQSTGQDTVGDSLEIDQLNSVGRGIPLFD